MTTLAPKVAGAAASSERIPGRGSRVSSAAAPAAVGLSPERRARLIAHSLGAPAADVTFSVAPPVPVPASLETDCRCAADRFLDRDAETLAFHSGLSARVLNHQRERNFDRRSALESVCRMFYGARAAGWGYERRMLLAAPILAALGAQAAPELAVEGTIGIAPAATRALREVSEAISVSLEALRDDAITGSELATITADIQQAITELHRLQREAEIAAGRRA